MKRQEAEPGTSVKLISTHQHEKIVEMVRDWEVAWGRWWRSVREESLNVATSEVQISDIGEPTHVPVYQVFAGKGTVVVCFMPFYRVSHETCHTV